MAIHHLPQVNQKLLRQKNELLQASQTSAVEELDPPEKTKGEVLSLDFIFGPCTPSDEVTGHLLACKRD